MKSGMGKRKGSQFERDVCVMLSKWVTNGTRTDVFWRSAMSGGRATVAHRTKGKLLSSQAGDLSCVHPDGALFISKFVVECKFYRDLEFDGLLTGKGKLLQFWNKLQAEAKLHDKIPFLVCKQNRIPAYIALNRVAATKLMLHDIRFLLISHRYNLYIIEASEFVKVCKL